MSAGMICEMTGRLQAVLSNVSGEADRAGLVAALQCLVNVAQDGVRRLALVEDRSGCWESEGFTSSSVWLSQCSGLSRGGAREVLRQARQLEHMPASSVAAGSGRLNEAQVRLLAKCRAAAPERYDAEIDQTLSSLDTVEELAVAAQLWLSAAEDDDVDGKPKRRDRPERAGVYLSETFGGMWRLDGWLTAQDGHILNQALEQQTGRMLQARRLGDESLAEMSLPAMRAQALVDLADLALRREPSETRSNRYQTLLVLRVGADGVIGPDGPFPVEGMCDSTVAKLVFGADGEVLNLGRAQRLCSEPQAKALRARDRCCRFPGCGRPAGWTDVHHCVEWRHGGATDLDNLVLLCRWHHTFIHRRHWSVSVHGDQITFTKPDGTVHALMARARPPAEPRRSHRPPA